MDNKFKPKIEITFGGSLTLNETELRALDALVGYGTKEFLDTFYNMGTHYMKPHEQGIYTLFETIRNQVKPQIYAIDRAHKVMHEVIKEKAL
jgi:hypothetical protein